MKSSAVETAIAVFMAGVAAAIAAICGFVGGIFLTARLPGEMSEWGLIVAPASALVCGTLAFVFTFWKVATYGHPPESKS